MKFSIYLNRHVFVMRNVPSVDPGMRMKNFHFVLDGVLGGSCEFKADCLDGNSICFQLKCQCGVGFTPDGDICAPLGKANHNRLINLTLACCFVFSSEICFGS